MKQQPGGPRPNIVWFRHDLRLADNPALTAAARGGVPVIPVYIWSPAEEGAWPPGGASKWWLHQSLISLEAQLRAAGSRLLLREGPALTALQRLISETGAAGVFWNRRYEPVIRERDAQIERALQVAGIEARAFEASLLFEPAAIRNKAGKPFQVFTHFWRHCLGLPEPSAPLAAPTALTPPARWPRSEPLEQLRLAPVPDWAGGLRSAWQPGAGGAGECLERFLAEAFDEYEGARNRPDLPGTSRLSPYLHFGELSPRQIWHTLAKSKAANSRGVGGSRANSPVGNPSPTPSWRQSQFLAELGWREFSHHLLYHFPHTDTQPLRPEFARFRWRTNPAWLRAWQRGRTGYPFVDAGMRELWATGWMHNRVRMVVASFLVKDLLISWQEGARWFWDTLVDADLAQNTLGWQWTAGCGADAAPYFRIFNPVSQGEKFDPQGAYIRRWVPELAALPDPWVHQPHAAPAEVLSRSGVVLGKTYPHPIVSHAIAREVALETYNRLKKPSG